MQALVIAGTDRPELRCVDDHPQPTPGPGEVLIRVDLAGICATDLEIVRGYMQFRGVPGHEFVGQCVAGPDVLVGRRVVGEINCACGACELCRRGLPNHCPQRTVLGIAGRDGAFAEYLTLPARNCHTVPDTVSDQQAVFVEPLAAAAHVLDVTPIGPETRVALVGAGRLGLLIAQVLRTTGCPLTVLARNPRSRALCGERGITAVAPDEFTPTAEYDVVVEATGNADGLRLALQLSRPCGTIVLKSTYAEPAPVDLAPLVVHELRLVGNRCGAFGPALRLLADRAAAVDELVSEVYPLADGVAAFAAAADPANIKILLRPGAAQ